MISVTQRPQHQGIARPVGRVQDRDPMAGYNGEGGQKVAYTQGYLR